MKKLTLFSLLITTQAHAVKYWCSDKPNELRFPNPNRAGCFEVSDDFDTETADVVNGSIVVSASKVAAKQTRIAAENAAKAAKRQKIADCDAVLTGADSANSVAQLKEVVKCLVEYVK